MFNPGQNMTHKEQERYIYHTQTCACTEQSINMITDDVNGVSVSMVTVHVVWGLFPLMRFALETNVPPALSTGLSWLWGCREKRGRDGNITQLEDFSVDQLGRQFIYRYDMHIQSWQNFLCSDNLSSSSSPLCRQMGLSYSPDPSSPLSHSAHQEGSGNQTKEELVLKTGSQNCPQSEDTWG